MAMLYLLLLPLCLLPSLITAADSINQSQVIRDGDTIVSSGGTFEVGFFSPGSSSDRYVGIWYKNVPIRTVVWVANRNRAINDTSGMLMLNGTGNLVLLSQNGTLVWSASSTGPVQNPILQLLDSGNLVLKGGNNVSGSEVYLWQSFDYPSDTFLPGMKIGKDLRTGLEWSYTSWKSPDDPSPGDFTWGMENLDFPEVFGRINSMKYTGSGPWNGLRFSGAPQLTPNDLFSFGLISNQDEVYYIYHAINKSMFTRHVLNQTNYLWEMSTWSAAAQSWNVFLSVPKDYCDNYGLCGVYSQCQINQIPYCQCLKGFSPKFPDKWNANDWSQGCVRDKPLNCGTDVGFIRYSGLQLPDSANTSVYSSFDLKECRSRCLSNCSCMAYANSDIRGGGSGCVMWFSDLIDMKELPEGGQDIYIRMPASEIAKDGFKAWKIMVFVLAMGTVAGIFAVFYCICKTGTNLQTICKTGTNLQDSTEVRLEDQGNKGPKDDLEFPSFDLATISKATNNFSVQNKLGEGGFGPVYKGILLNGQEVAVKRLSSSSTQGAKEFKNEVILIANLQHRNLVKLLGCCIQGDERMLIYEYMPNRSLDAFIFDETRSNLLDWGKRFHIICGIARGLLYLHQDSRLRIIHRDLKASNVLLDDEMNPKISDFGMARMFGGDETEGNTKRIVGTYGYMAPEYAIDGLFSVKSDVFSFGILVLEIISGKRNRGYYKSDLNLVGHAWKLYLEGKSPELINPCLLGACLTSEVSRCIHIALLCLQEYAEDRPSMASVVVMLSSEGSIPFPKHPLFLADRIQLAGNSSSSGVEPCSNGITVTVIEAR